MTLTDRIISGLTRLVLNLFCRRPTVRLGPPPPKRLIRTADGNGPSVRVVYDLRAEQPEPVPPPGYQADRTEQRVRPGYQVEEQVRTERVSISSIRANPDNVREHGDRNIETIKASLEQFGQQSPLVVDPTGLVVKGNGTLAAAAALGWTELDIVRTDLTGDKARAYALTDNRTSELSRFDPDLLAAELSGLADSEIDFGSLGFEPAEIAGDDGEEANDEGPPLVKHSVLPPPEDGLGTDRHSDGTVRRDPEDRGSDRQDSRVSLRDLREWIELTPSGPAGFTASVASWTVDRTSAVRLPCASGGVGIDACSSVMSTSVSRFRPPGGDSDDRSFVSSGSIVSRPRT